MPDSLPDRVGDFIRLNSLLKQGDRVLVAFSGGPDSTCLLLILAGLRDRFALDLRALYVDHGLRPAEEIAGDLAFCRAICDRAGVVFHVEKVDVRGSLKEKPGNLQERARRLRLGVLESRAADAGADRIAVGHTLDDQVETVLMRLLRGAGPRGLAGMAPSRDLFIRPLLSTGRREIETHLAELGIKPRLDSSNAKGTYFRNRIRQRLIPVIEELSPAFREPVARTARLLFEEDRYLQGIATSAGAALVIESRPGPAGPVIVFDRPAFLALPRVIQRRVLLGWVGDASGGRHGLSVTHIEVLLESMVRGSGGHLPGGWIVRIESGRAVLSRSPSLNDRGEDESVLPVPGRVVLPDGRVIEASLALPGEPAEGCGKNSVAIDRGLIKNHLVVRTRRPGDVFHPFGMNGHRKKLQDFLVDEKVPRSERDGVAIVTDGERIVWVVGFRVDGRFVPKGAAGETIRLRLTG